ncbi:MAG TPA: aminotransferase class I/II-fold pyridoxal phosphate-dependent enzyme, partial [Saprospiraceae bacterium]|nr:aminotransferase class I/II-fold pyridoxal phosphate-dependent enzyme [Saprospiraceae bacterium]
MHHHTISKRGLKASQTALRSDMHLYFRALSNMYHPDDNPDGDFPLNVAENKLNWSMLKAKMEDVTKEKSIPHWVAGYTSSLGHQGFREIVSGFLSRYLAKYPISAHQIALSAGATSVIDVTSWILGDAGDVAVFPAPCYPVYKQDIGNKAAIERYDLITHHDTDELNKGLILTQAHLEKTKQDITESGKQMKMLVLTQPDNPTGSIYTKDQLEMAAQWCIQNEIHLIVNEIYGLCLLDINDSSITNDYDDPIVFTSFTEMIHQYNSPYLHLWYALSKDLGISGMRIGLLYTHNELLLRAYENLNAPSMISNHTQWLLGEILSDYTFMDLFLSKQKQSLTEVYVLVT